MLKLFFICLYSCIATHSQHRVGQHPLYVSVTNLAYNQKEQSIEIISKIFMDDLEKAINSKYKSKLDLFKGNIEANKPYILSYMQSVLNIQIDRKKLQFTLIGYEQQKDACWIYLEIPSITHIKNVEIENKILYDFTDKQINLIHFEVNSKQESSKLTYPDSSVKYSF